MSVIEKTDQHPGAPSPDEIQGPEGPSFFAQSQAFNATYSDLILPDGAQLHDGPAPQTGTITRLKLAIDTLPTPPNYVWQVITSPEDDQLRVDEAQLTLEGDTIRTVTRLDGIWEETEPIAPDALQDIVTDILGSDGFAHYLFSIKTARAEGQQRLARLQSTGEVLVSGNSVTQPKILRPQGEQLQHMLIGFERQANLGFAAVGMSQFDHN